MVQSRKSYILNLCKRPARFAVIISAFIIAAPGLVSLVRAQTLADTGASARRFYLLKPEGAPPPAPLNTIWTGGAGNYSNSAMWTNGVPNGNFNAFIDGGKAVASAVTLDINASVNNLTISAGDSLGISNNLAYTVNGTSISNAGQLNMNSVGNGTFLVVGGPSLTLSGAGALTLSSNSQNFIEGAATANTLVNQSTIQGAGSIGNGQMTLVNSGTIDANVGTQLIVNPNGGTTNTGTLEATSGATLNLQDAVTNTGGTITANGSGSTVFVNGAAITGGTLSTANGGVIQSQGGSFGALTNAGTLQVLNNSSATLTGNIVNTGAIQLNSVGNGTFLVIGAPSVTLSGAGAVTLSNNAQNFITGASGTDTLVNESTIQGAGAIGNNQLTLKNFGTIDANASTQLIINPSGGTTNSGTLEATAGGTLNLQNAVTNTGAIIQANGAGSVVSLQGASITGGTLSTSAGGVVQSFGATLTGLTNAGSLQVTNNNAVTLAGNISNTGSIQLGSVGNGTFLNIAGTVNLSGGGTVVLSDNSQNFVTGAAGTQLVNENNTISGSGNIGNGTMAFTNEGTVDAIYSTHLIINTGTAAGSNSGTMEASSGGVLEIDSKVTNETSTTTGTIEALNGGTVSLKGATISGGNLLSTGTGIISAADATLDGSALAVNVSGKLETPNNYNLNLRGTINDDGTIILDSVGNGTTLKIIGPTVTLQGTGLLSLSDNTQNFIKGATSGTEQLINKITIAGAGNVGDDFLTLNNEGTIEATSKTGHNLVIDPGTGGATNTGTMTAVNGATLELANSINNTGGTISAGTGSTVLMDGSLLLSGGTLKGAGTFVSNGASLSNLSSAGTIQVSNNSSLTLAGTLTNSGSIQLNSVGNGTFLNVSGATTLTGAGTISLSDNSQNFVSGASGSSLINQNNTISGSGNIGDNTIAFTNQGTVDATSAGGNHLIIQAGGAGATNTSLMEASSGGTLDLQNTVNNTGGTITALAGTGTSAGGTVVLNSGTVTGGTLTTAGTGVNAGVIISNHGTLASLTNAGAIEVQNNSAVSLKGTINNTGTIALNSAGNGTFMFIDGNVTLNGVGSVVLSNNSQNFIQGAVTGQEVLTNNSTIEGSGNIGNAAMGLVNNGLILANQSTPLFIDASSAGFKNPGTLEVNAGSSLDINGPFSNFSGTTLTGGKYVVDGTLQFTGANIVTNAATITLSGPSAVIIDQTGANALANFTTNAAAGKFTLTGGLNLLTSAGSFSNAGTLIVNTGSTFTVGNGGNTSIATNYTQSAGVTTVNGTLTSSTSAAGTPTVSVQGGTLFGDGTVADPLTSSGIVNPGDSTTATGKLDVTGTYAQSSKGSLDISVGGVTAGTNYDQLDVSGKTTLSGTLNINTTSGFVPKVGATFDILNAGSIAGKFASVTGTSINGSEHYVVSYTGTEVILTVASGADAGYTPTQVLTNMFSASRGRGYDQLDIARAGQVHPVLAAGSTPQVANFFSFAKPELFSPRTFSNVGAAAFKVAPMSSAQVSLAQAITPRFAAANTGLSPLGAHSNPLSFGSNPNRKVMNYHMDLGSMIQVTRDRGLAGAMKLFTTHYSNLGYLEYR